MQSFALGDIVTTPQGEGVVFKADHLGELGIYLTRQAVTVWMNQSCTSLNAKPSASCAALRASALRNTWSRAAGRSGTDPEIWAFSPSGKLIPAWEFLPPEPEAVVVMKYPGAERPEGCFKAAKLHWDGPQAELSTESGTFCHEILTDDIQAGLKGIYQKANAFCPGAKLVCEDIVKLPAALLRSADEAHIELGCSPSYNAYGLEPIAIGDPRQHPLRYAGCHLHESLAAVVPKWFPEGTIIMMDKLLGLPLTALGRGWENPLRRIAYGRPGEYRLPSAASGSVRLEYRTPGAFLLRSPKLFNFALDLGRTAFRLGMLMDGRDIEIPDIHEIILNCDADTAAARLRKHRSLYEAVLEACYDAKRLGSATSTSIIRNTLDVLASGACAAFGSLDPNTEWGLTTNTWPQAGSASRDWAFAMSAR